MRILFVHEVNYENKVIFEMHEFPELLANEGNEVTFLQFDEGFKFWRSRSVKRKTTIPGRVVKGVHLELATPFQLGVPGLDRVIAVLTSMPLLWKLFRDKSFDIVVLYAVPTYGIQTLKIAKHFRVPVVFRALDVSHLIRGTAFKLPIKLIERYLYKRATLISANNPAMARYCLELAGREHGARVNFPPLDVSHFQVPGDSEGLRIELGFEPTDIVVVYMGTFFSFSGLDQVLRTMKSVAESNPRVRLLLVGGGEKDAELRRLVEDLGLQNLVKFTGFVDYQNLPIYLQAANVAINPMVPQLVSRTAFPHKVLQYMAAGVPVVSTKLDGIFETFGSTSGITWVASPSDVLLEAVRLGENPEEAAILKYKQDEVVESMLSIRGAIDDFVGVLKESMEIDK
jgi:glycosyltransferase involved in cell wall biosynthesis